MTVSRGTTRCAKLGRVTRNPYLNFLRDYRLCHSGKSMVQIICKGAKLWNGLSIAQKSKYQQQACNAPKHKTKRRRKLRRSSSMYC